ncbi:MAG: N-acetyltransferase [Planctomycetes bacterium]|nr:N-acetyltransferase [Planctomycetota bacterium]
MKEYFVHESSYVDEGVRIGKDTKIWHFCHVMSGATIGENCILGNFVFVGRGVSIGNGVKIQNHVSVFEGVTLEDGVFCGPSMTFTNVVNPRSEIERKHEFKKTLVRRGATIGAGATILCGTTLGLYAFVGAGAVVTRDLPDFALAYGSPARVHGWVCRCGVGLGGGEDAGGGLRCPACDRRYRLSGDGRLAEVGPG